MTDVLTQNQEQQTTLPDSWIQATFGDLADYLNGRAFKKSEWHSTGRPIIRIQNLTGSSGTLNRFTGPVEDRYIVRDGELLISWSATLGAYVYRGEEAVLNQHIFKVEPYVNRRFLFYLTNAYIDDLRRQAHGSGMQHITKSKFEASKVPLPPLNEQHRIVEKIEELFTKLDAGIRSLEQTQALLKSYRRSVLKAAVEGELSREWREAHKDALEPASELLEKVLQERREKFAGKKYTEPPSADTSKLPALPEGWEWASLSQLLREPLRNGHSAKADKKGRVRTLTLTAVTVGDFSEANTKLTGADPNHVSDLWLEPGDIFVERSNTPELVGTARLYTGERNFAIFPDLLIRARILNIVSARYVELALQSSRVRSYFKKSARGISGSMPKISQSTIEAAPIPLPPTQETRFIVEEVERRLSVVDKLEATVEANLKQAGGLRQAIFKQAFSGELVPQKPDDEPASVLLERIRQERETTNPKGRKKNARATKNSPSAIESPQLFPEQGA